MDLELKCGQCGHLKKWDQNLNSHFNIWCQKNKLLPVAINVFTFIEKFRCSVCGSKEVSFQPLDEDSALLELSGDQTVCGDTPSRTEDDQLALRRWLDMAAFGGLPPGLKIPSSGNAVDEQPCNSNFVSKTPERLIYETCNSCFRPLTSCIC